MAYDFDWKVTVVLDKKPFGQSKELMAASPNASFIWPAEPLSYAECPSSGFLEPMAA